MNLILLHDIIMHLQSYQIFSVICLLILVLVRVDFISHVLLIMLLLLYFCDMREIKRLLHRRKREYLKAIKKKNI